MSWPCVSTVNETLQKGLLLDDVLQEGDNIMNTYIDTQHNELLCEKWRIKILNEIEQAKRVREEEYCIYRRFKRSLFHTILKNSVDTKSIISEYTSQCIDVDTKYKTRIHYVDVHICDLEMLRFEIEDLRKNLGFSHNIPKNELKKF